MAEALRAWTIDDFLAWEREQEERYEFLDGFIRCMVGGTADHNTIIGNLFAALKAQLQAKPCRAFIDGIKVLSAASILYPDLVVTCAPVEPKSDIVPAPAVVIEVLSRSTADFDRGRKWLAYQQIPSLLHYGLVSQDERRIDLYTRHGDGWQYRVLGDRDEALVLDGIACRVPLAAVYADTSLAR